MLPAFTNRLVFTDHGDASYFGMGPYTVIREYRHRRTIQSSFVVEYGIIVEGRDAFGEIRTREIGEHFLNTDGMTLI